MHNLTMYRTRLRILSYGQPFELQHLLLIDLKLTGFHWVSF